MPHCEVRLTISHEETEQCGRASVEVVRGKHICSKHLEYAKGVAAKDEHAESFAVVVSEYGDAIHPTMITEWVFKEDYNDPVLGYLAEHATCNGMIDIHKTSDTHQTFRCRKCDLRLVVPLTVTNWRELRDFFSGAKPEVARVPEPRLGRREPIPVLQSKVKWPGEEG